jgi:hypothetical protein
MTAAHHPILYLKFGFHMAQSSLQVHVAQSATGRRSIKYRRSTLLCRKEQGIVLPELGALEIENGRG